jgi:hypothetical protein
MFGTPVSVWYQKYIEAYRFPFMMLTATNKERNKLNVKEVMVSVLKSLIQKNNLIDICLLQKLLRFF